MFRVTVLSIVLVLAASPTAAFFCTIWCESPGTGATAEERCHHHAVLVTVSVAGDDTCERLALTRNAFVREETERLVSSSAVHHGILAAGHDPAGVTARNHSVVNHLVGGLFTKPPLSPVRRI